MQTVSRQQATELIDQRDDLVVVETLDEKYFQEFHLPGAHNISLDDCFADNIGNVSPDKSTPVLVYCMDTDCEASSKAARKLGELGYTEVYDYEAGKVDWKEAGLPVEVASGSTV